MGMLERSKSLMRKPSIRSSSRKDNEQEKRKGLGGVVNVTHGLDIESTYLLTLDAKQSQRPEHSKQHRRHQSVSSYEDRPTTPKQRLSHRASVQGLMSSQHRTLSVRHSTTRDASREVLQLPNTSINPSTAFTMAREEAQLFNRNRATIGITLGSPRMQPPNYLDSPAVSAKSSPYPSPAMNMRHSSPITPMHPIAETCAPAEVRQERSRGFRAFLRRTGSDLASMLPKQRKQSVQDDRQPPTDKSQSTERWASGASRTTREESAVHDTVLRNKKPLPEVPSSAQGAKILRRSSAPMRSPIRAPNEQSTPRYIAIETGRAHDSPTKPSGTGLRLTKRPLPTRMSSLPVSHYNTTSPILDITIPESQMERYSVMFEKVLPPQPTLLERRRVSIARLQPLGENPAKVSSTVGDTTYYIDANMHEANQATESGNLQRRATSPTKPTANTSPDESPESYPRTHIISAQNDDRVQVARPMKFVRSVTAPVVSLSAPRRTDLTSPAWSEPSLPPTPVSGRTFNSMGEDMSICPNECWTTARSTQSDASTNPVGRPAPRRVDSLGPQKASEIQSQQAAQVEAVQISIARKVSVTRRPGPMQKAVVVQRSSKPQVVEVVSRKKSILGLIEQ